jgi:hypothetical protein
VAKATRHLLIIASLVFIPLSLGSCASSQPRVNDVQQMGQRLQGVWLFQNFRPTMPLEPALSALLTLQLGQLRVSVDASRITAQGPGLQVARTYQIQEAVDQSATLLVTDQTGVAVRVWVEFSGNELTFRPMDAPWTGEGTLRRL